MPTDEWCYKHGPFHARYSGEGSYEVVSPNPGSWTVKFLAWATTPNMGSAMSLAEEWNFRAARYCIEEIP